MSTIQKTTWCDSGAEEWRGWPQAHDDLVVEVKQENRGVDPGQAFQAMQEAEAELRFAADCVSPELDRATRDKWNAALTKLSSAMREASQEDAIRRSNAALLDGIDNLKKVQREMEERGARQEARTEQFFAPNNGDRTPDTKPPHNASAGLC